MSDSTTLETAVAALAMATATIAVYRLSNKNTNNKPKNTYLLAGDVGGTNTRLALYDTTESNALHHKEYLNSKYTTDGNADTFTFENEIIEPFLKEWYEKTFPNGTTTVTIFSCFAVAGPVADNCATMTNLVFGSNQNVEVRFDGDAIERSNHGMLSSIRKASVINDFVGQGYGILTLDPHDTNEVISLTPNSPGLIQPNGTKVCVGAGTGLGECFLTASPSSGDYVCYPSEGGHVDYTPRSDLQRRLLDHLIAKHGQEHRVSVERVVSGRGLADVYEFLATKEKPDKIVKDVHREFLGEDDLRGKVVGEAANRGQCGLCKEAVEIMMEAYGAEVGNCAVTFIPTGGLYVTGGLTPKNIDFIAGKDGEDTVFGKAYWDKGRVAGVLEKIPLFAVMVQDVGLRGARFIAKRNHEEYISNA